MGAYHTGRGSHQQPPECQHASKIREGERPRYQREALRRANEGTNAVVPGLFEKVGSETAQRYPEGLAGLRTEPLPEGCHGVLMRQAPRDTGAHGTENRHGLHAKLEPSASGPVGGQS